MRRKIAIYGAGGFGREVHMLINQINELNDIWEFVGYYDDGIPEGTVINDFPVIGNFDKFYDSETIGHIVFAIGNPKEKSMLANRLKGKDIAFPKLIHPTAKVGDFNKIGDGCIVCAGVIITVNCTIGSHVILNLQCTVGHDTVIGDYSSFMPGVNISGEIQLGEGVYVGTGAKIINKLTIGSYSTIGAGAVVTKDIPQNCTAVGMPAKPIKFH